MEERTTGAHGAGQLKRSDASSFQRVWNIEGG